MVNISSLLRFARFKYKLLFEKQSKWMSGASVNTLTEMALPEHDVPMCEWKSKNQRIWKANINQNICIFRSSVVWLPRTRNFVNCYCLQISEAHLAGKKEKFPSSHDEVVHICRQRNNCVINRNFVYTCKSFIFRQRAREREKGNRNCNQKFICRGRKHTTSSHFRLVMNNTQKTHLYLRKTKYFRLISKTENGMKMWCWPDNRNSAFHFVWCDTSTLFLKTSMANVPKM